MPNPKMKISEASPEAFEVAGDLRAPTNRRTGILPVYSHTQQARNLFYISSLYKITYQL
jgi:hypothetical protein